MTTPALVAVSETYLDATGAPRRGAIEISWLRAVSAGDQVLVPAGKKRVEIAADGTIAVSLMASDDPVFSPVLGPYTIRELFFDGGGLTFQQAVPLAAVLTGIRLDGGSGTGGGGGGGGGSTLVGYGFFIDSTGVYIDTTLTGGLSVQLDGATGDVYVDDTVTTGTAGALVDSTTGQPYVNV